MDRGDESRAAADREDAQGDMRVIIAGKLLRPGEPACVPGSVAIQAGRIAAAGSPDEIRSRFPNAAVCDLDDAVLCPAFADRHLHLAELVQREAAVDLSACTDEAGLARALASGRRESTWTSGYGLDLHRFAGWSRHPRGLLDEAVPNRPCAIFSRDLHSLFANTQALAAAGLDASGDGHLAEDEGRPVRDALSLPDGEAWQQALGRVASRLHAQGIVAVDDFSGLPVHARLAVRAAELPLRIRSCIHLHELDDPRAAGYATGAGQGRLRCGPLKLFGDGSLGSRSAWMIAPYARSTDCGWSAFDDAELGARVRLARSRGLCVALHAIGDAAVRQAARVLGAFAPLAPDRPDRIEHAQHLAPGDERLLAAAGLGACVNPVHMEADWQAADRLLGARAAGSYALRSMLAAGIPLVFGSDAPVGETDPVAALRWAVLRQDARGRPAGGWHAEQRIELAAALDCCWASWLRPGEAADLQALDRDPLALGAERLDELHCLQVWLDGQARLGEG
ncbi:MAG: amidohydrolase family protein [Deltaproteobacteria bacterium]|nr:amidohydrolase family protein [Deltaproteobacteria bacterium]